MHVGKQLMSLPLDHRTMAEYPDLPSACAEAGCDGLEMIWGGEELPENLPKEVRVGYHLAFYPDWLDFWNGDLAALRLKFGSDQVWREFYGGEGRERLLAFYREDLERAALLEAQYVVFHVSDVSVEEGYTYQWLHTDRAVIEAAIELLNLLFAGQDWPFDLLVENQWWPGFTFTNPKQTAMLLDGIRFPRKGIMLDTGHLMNCNLELTTEAEGVRYLHEMLDRHGELCRAIQGVHLHQSLSGAFVKTHTGKLPQSMPADYYGRYSVGYGQILAIDRHEPWHEPAIQSVLQRIEPQYVVHELCASSRKEREQRIAVQQRTLRQL